MITAGPDSQSPSAVTVAENLANKLAQVLGSAAGRRGSTIRHRDPGFQVSAQAASSVKQPPLARAPRHNDRATVTVTVPLRRPAAEPSTCASLQVKFIQVGN